MTGLHLDLRGAVPTNAVANDLLAALGDGDGQLKARVLKAIGGVGKQGQGEDFDVGPLHSGLPIDLDIEDRQGAKAPIGEPDFDGRHSSGGANNPGDHRPVRVRVLDAVARHPPFRLLGLIVTAGTAALQRRGARR
jgi:hypothetical protein